MKKFTKALALVLAIALMIPSVAAFAKESPAKTTLKSANVTVSASTYTGKALTPKVTVKVGKTTLKNGKDYIVTVSAKKVVNAGKYTVTVKGKGKYAGTVKKAWTVKKANQKVTVSPSKKTVKRGQSFSIKVKGNKVKSVSYKSSSKAVKVAKNGKVTVSKKAKRGTTYKVTVTVAGNKNYNKAVKTIKVTVK